MTKSQSKVYNFEQYMVDEQWTEGIRKEMVMVRVNIPTFGWKDLRILRKISL
jgi:hypothetical protein